MRIHVYIYPITLENSLAFLTSYKRQFHSKDTLAYSQQETRIRIFVIEKIYRKQTKAHQQKSKLSYIQVMEL